MLFGLRFLTVLFELQLGRCAEIFGAPSTP